MLPRNLIIPVTVIFVGVILLLGNMGIIPNELLAFWPVVLVVGGLVGLTSFDTTTKSTSTPTKTTTTSKKKTVTKKKTAKSRKK